MATMNGDMREESLPPPLSDKEFLEIVDDFFGSPAPSTYAFEARSPPTPRPTTPLSRVDSEATNLTRRMPNSPLHEDTVADDELPGPSPTGILPPAIVRNINIMPNSLQTQTKNVSLKRDRSPNQDLTNEARKKRARNADEQENGPARDEDDGDHESETQVETARDKVPVRGTKGKRPQSKETPDARSTITRNPRIRGSMKNELKNLVLTPLKPEPRTTRQQVKAALNGGKRAPRCHSAK